MRARQACAGVSSRSSVLYLLITTGLGSHVYLLQLFAMLNKVGKAWHGLEVVLKQGMMVMMVVIPDINIVCIPRYYKPVSRPRLFLLTESETHMGVSSDRLPPR